MYDVWSMSFFRNPWSHSCPFNNREEILLTSFLEWCNDILNFMSCNIRENYLPEKFVFYMLTLEKVNKTNCYISTLLSFPAYAVRKNCWFVNASLGVSEIVGQKLRQLKYSPTINFPHKKFEIWRDISLILKSTLELYCIIKKKDLMINGNIHRNIFIWNTQKSRMLEISMLIFQSHIAIIELPNYHCRFAI